MLSLANSRLQVDLLDPEGDADRLGPRYVWGGYVWQVHDRDAGPLLAGPEWPAPAPAAFNGQGLPESFRHSTRDGRPWLWDGARGLAPGAGELARDSSGALRVTQPCIWETTKAPGRMAFTTRQAVGLWEYRLQRDLVLSGRELRSVTRLTNAGRDPLALEWFAHPFFPLVNGRVHIQVRTPATLSANPGFSFTDGLLTDRRRFLGPRDGELTALELATEQPLVLHVTHPRVQPIAFSTSFAPSECLVWANGHTVSIEPYRLLALAPGETQTWSLRYDFGASSGRSPPASSGRTPAAL